MHPCTYVLLHTVPSHDGYEPSSLPYRDDIFLEDEWHSFSDLELPTRAIVLTWLYTSPPQKYIVIYFASLSDLD